MTVWVLFVWMSASFPTAWSYDVKADCEQAAADYKRAVCVAVVVPKK